MAQGVAILLLAGGRAATAADLCRSLSYDAGAMTRVVDKLEERGLVKRVRGTHDRRSARLELTREGKTMHAQVTRVQVDTLNRMLRGFTKSEARLLEALLRRIVENANGEDA